MICGKCGSKNLGTKSAKGGSFPYKQYISVKVLVDVYLTACLDCDNILLMAGDCERLNKALEDSIPEVAYGQD